MIYIVTADYYDWDGIKDRYYWFIAETTPFYTIKDIESKVRGFVQRIIQESDADVDITEVDIHIYELGNEVTDKFLNDK